MKSIMLSIDWATLGIVLTILSAVSSLTWWLSGQFSTVKQLVYERLGEVEKTLIGKLEYHERHDDDRFSQIREDFSELRVRNAAKDALMTTIVNKLDKLNA